MPSKSASKKKKKDKKKSRKTIKPIKSKQSEQSMLKSMFCDCIELFLSLLAVICVGILYDTFWSNSPLSPLLDSITEQNAIPKIYKPYSNPIDTISWADINGDTHLQKMRIIGRNRKPILIRNAPSQYWRANREWKLSQNPRKSIEYLSKLHYENNLKFRGKSQIKNEGKMPSNIDSENVSNDIVSVYRMNNSNFFTFSDRQRPFMEYEMLSSADIIESINVSFVDFLQYLNNKKYSKLNVNNSYLYYFNSAKNVYQDLSPMHWFKMRDKTVAFTENHRRELIDINEINLEISPTRLFINAYYDITHNFFYQIDGSRHFLVSPPSESLKFRSFPEGHPSYRSSQIPHKFYNIPFDFWILRKSRPFPPPSKESIQAWNVTIEARDLLYIPPFYWTQITTLQSSIAIKSASLGFEQIFAALSDPNLLPKALHKSAKNVQKQKYALHILAYFTRVLIDRILKALPESDSLSEFNDALEWEMIHAWIRAEMIQGRYKGGALWQDMQCLHFEPVRCPQTGNSTELEMRDVEQTAQTWAFAYKQMKEYVRDESDLIHIRNLMLVAHIEQFVSHIAGHLNYCYFVQCLASERFASLHVESEHETMKRKMEERMREQQM